LISPDGLLLKDYFIVEQVAEKTVQDLLDYSCLECPLADPF